MPMGGGGSKQLKIPPGGRFGRGCKISYIFFGREGVTLMSLSRRIRKSYIRGKCCTDRLEVLAYIH